MKKITLLLLIIYPLLLVQAQCPDFMDLYGPNVTCYYGTTSNPAQHIGIAPGRHTIINQQGTDPITGNQLPFLPPGESTVIKLGNENVGAEAEAISYTFTVDPNHVILLLKFAVVLEDPHHVLLDQPRFVVRVFNNEGMLVDPCAEYNVYASENIPGFQSFGRIRFRPWTNIGIDLSTYVGQTVTVQFTTYDCSYTGHFGYAYFTASCLNVRNQLSLVGCDGEHVTLSAPENFESYEWSNGATTPTTTYTIGEGDTMVYCSITSATGCHFTLDGTLTSEENIPSVNTTYYDTICEGESYTQHSFSLPEQYQTGTQIHRNTFFNPSTCSGGDITVTLYLTVVPTITEINDDFCLSELEYNAHGFHYSNLQEGVLTDTLIINHSDRCDEIIILHLTVHPNPFFFHIYDHTCQGSSYNNYGFQYFNLQAGEIIDTLINNDVENECRIVILHLTVETLPTSRPISGETNVCNREIFTYTYPQENNSLTFYWSVPNGVTIIDGQNTASANIYFSDDAPNPATISLSATNSCGTQHTSLEVFHGPTYYYFLLDTLCTGNEYHKNGFDLSRQDSTGWFTFITSHTSTLGCDSVHVLRLFITSSPTINTLAQPNDICEGENSMIEAMAENPDITHQDKINIGDIYCSDGTIVKPSIWPASGKVAEGIVFHVNYTGEHGWIVHVRDQSIVDFWSNQYTDIVQLPDYFDFSSALTDTNGYSNTQIIRNFGNASSYPAVWLVDFDNGWYLPAAGQLRILYSVIPTLNTSLQLVRGTLFTMNYDFHYLSSSEHNGTNIWELNETGALNSFHKHDLGITRSVRSF